MPTIFSGRIKHSDDSKPSVAKKKMTQVSGTKFNNKEHKVKIVGDSRLRGTATRIDQYLNRKFVVCSWIKLGANTEELVDTLENVFKCLGKKDVIVINGGAYDIGSKRNQISRVLVKMTQIMQQYNNTNIIVVNIPHRYDTDRNSATNLEIQAFKEI
jgi:lysophospholipase L1-like esterase